ncbi:hypothetical protein F5884DRAFT_748449 [Xylogone sp. PMI_703]|nr:hypothetical protein F5884DRAFT_748449 [Xylogone sp. PMI_703]
MSIDPYAGDAKDVVLNGSHLRLKRAGDPVIACSTSDSNDRSLAQGKIHVQASRGLSGFEIQASICYTRNHLPRGGLIDLAFQDLRLDDINITSESIKDAELHHRAVLGFAMIFFGSRHKQPSIVRYGYIIHGGTLRQLNHILSTPKCYDRDDVLLSVAILALLERFVPTGRKHYFKHIDGMERLLQLRGPSFHSSPGSYEMYKVIRCILIFASLSMKKLSILAQEEWKSPPTDTPVEKLKEHALFNILATCTPAVAELHKLTENQELGSQYAVDRCESISRTAHDLLEQLYNWKEGWDNEHKSCQFGVPITSIGLRLLGQKECADTATIFPIVYTFTNMSASNILMLYNATLINVLRVLRTVAARFTGIQLNQYPINLLSLPYTENEYVDVEQTAALDICRCIPYHLASESSLGPGSMTVAHFAVRTAWLSLDGSNSLGGQWISDLLQKVHGDIFPKCLWMDGS